MRLKCKKLKFLLMIIIVIAICSLSKVVFGLTIAPPPLEPYMYDSKLYCRNHNQGYYLYAPNGIAATRLIEYGISGSTELEQSIAFAFYTAMQGNWNSANIQTVIWASGQFAGQPNYKANLVEYTGSKTSPTSSSLIIARSNQFAQFYYGILRGGQKLQLNTTANDVKVLVDQADQTYTVGPYTIDVTTGNLSGAVKDAKTILYNELAGINAANYPGSVPFASYTLEGVDGTNIKFVDRGGNEIAFPNWNDPFYIRFNPTNGVTTVNPKIKINYIPKMTSSAYLYDGTKGSIEGIIDGIFVEKSKFNPGDFVYEGTLKEHGIPSAAIKLNVVSYTITGTANVITGQHQEYDSSTGSYITVPDYTEFVTSFRYKAEIDPPTRLQQLLYFVDVDKVDDTVEVNLGTKDVSMEIGGNVWLDLPGLKIGDITGVRSSEDTPYQGMEVRLYEVGGNLAATTVSDNQGRYHFYNLNPLKKYIVKFVYNGEIYQATYYKNALTGGYSNAQDEGRDAFNNKFASISSSPENYKVGNSWHKSYAMLSKLSADNGEYIENGKDQDGNVKALTFEDAWNKFLELVPNNGSYQRAYTELDNWLRTKGVGSKDRSGVITYIEDCMINATTHVDDPLTQDNSLVAYPVYDQFVLEDLANPTTKVETVTLDRTYSYLYTQVSDQSRYVDFGITRREQEDLYMQKDVYKATVIVNGKKQEYMYSKKNVNADGSWSVEVRAADELYNGSYTYSREIRKSEYLYDGSEDGNIAKNLQVYVTYRLLLKNYSTNLYASINEVVDFYDADQYTFDGTLRSDGKYDLNQYNEYDQDGNVSLTYVNSYVGKDAQGTKLEGANLVVSNSTMFGDRPAQKTLSNGNYNYSSLYISGIKSETGNDRLACNENAYVYLTFKANVDPATGKVKLDQDLNTGDTTIGKRNIAEINGYSTYYAPEGKIPAYLNADDSINDTLVGNKVAGIINNESNPGSLETVDLTQDGDLRSSKDNEVQNRLEMDTDKAPNMKIIINQNDDDTRRLTGYVYDDERTVESSKAVVGNGKYDEGEAKVNGVKAELVELVQDVDENGIFKGSYSGEKVWGSLKYDFQDGKLQKVEENNDRYYSGYGSSKVILSGPGILNVAADELGANNGSYSFKSLPAGDFFIRYTYGDSTQTVLTNSDNEVNTLVGIKGLNEKSYNGQDYKSTVYQTEVDQNTNYNGISGFINFDSQNYYNNIEQVTNSNLPSKDAMYYYDIDRSANVQGASDAKDIYGNRLSVNKYSSGADGKVLLNNRAEILNSFDKVGTYKYDTTDEQKEAQLSMINDLINNTKMTAQTGVINTEVERNTKVTPNQGKENKLPYTIDDIDLGLQERPKAQLKLNKQIANFKLVLANKQTLFDTTQSVHNLYYAKHNGHTANFSGLKLVGFELGRNSKELPELIQAYMDEEIIAGASIEATYEISVENVGEVDYLDEKFYYIGQTDHPEDGNWVSTTSANEIIDYVSNKSRYEADYQDVESNWKVRNYKDIIGSSAKSEDGTISIDESKIDNDLVNRNYLESVASYNTIITTDRLSADLLPSVLDSNRSKTSTKLVLTALLSDSGDEDFVYNNLTELVSTSNKQGRRMSFSVVGNQEMADQSLGNDARDDLYTSADLVTPSEMDADSSQKIVILPPTGEDKNYVPIIIASIAFAIIVIVGIVIIKKVSMPKNK